MKFTQTLAFAPEESRAPLVEPTPAAGVIAPEPDRTETLRGLQPMIAEPPRVSAAARSGEIVSRPAPPRAQTATAEREPHARRSVASRAAPLIALVTIALFVLGLARRRGAPPPDPSASASPTPVVVSSPPVAGALARDPVAEAQPTRAQAPDDTAPATPILSPATRKQPTQSNLPSTGSSPRHARSEPSAAPNAKASGSEVDLLSIRR